jgi:hypothetical protein
MEPVEMKKCEVKPTKIENILKKANVPLIVARMSLDSFPASLPSAPSGHSGTEADSPEIRRGREPV